MNVFLLRAIRRDFPRLLVLAGVLVCIGCTTTASSSDSVSTAGTVDKSQSDQPTTIDTNNGSESANDVSTQADSTIVTIGGHGDVVGDSTDDTIDSSSDSDLDGAQDTLAVDDQDTSIADAVIGPPDPEFVGCSDGTREGFIDRGKYPLIAACSGAWLIPGVHNYEPACDRNAGNSGENKIGKGCNVTDLCAEGWHVCLGKDDVLLRNKLGCNGIMDGLKEPAFFLARTSSKGAFICTDDSLLEESKNKDDIYGCGNLGCFHQNGKGTCSNEKSKVCDPLNSTCTNDAICTASPCFPLNSASHNLCNSLKPDAACKCKTVAGKVTCSGGTLPCKWCSTVARWEHVLQKQFKPSWDCGTNGTNEANNVVKKTTALGGVMCCKDI